MQFFFSSLTSITTTIRYSDVKAAGLAFVGTACTNLGISITQSGTLYTTVSLAAHEIGHK